MDSSVMFVTKKFSVSIATRVAIAFIAMVTLLVFSGLIGNQGIQKLSDNLSFLTEKVWQTSDASLLTRLNLLEEMLVNEQIISNSLSVSEGTEKIQQHQKESLKALEQVSAISLLDNAVTEQTQVLIRQYQNHQGLLIGEYTRFLLLRDEFRNLNTHFMDSISEAIQTIEYQLVQSAWNTALVADLEEIIFLLNDLRMKNLLLSFSVQDFMSSDQPESALKKVRLQQNELKVIFGRVAEKIQHHSKLAEIAQNADGFRKRIFSNVDQLIEKYLSFKKQRAVVVNSLEQLKDSLNGVQNKSQRIAIFETQRSYEMVEESSVLFISVSVIGILIAISAFLLIFITVVKPIRHVSESLMDISKGEGSLSATLNESGATELASLATGFNIFVGKIRKTIGGVSSAIDGLSQEIEVLKNNSESTKAQIHKQFAETEQTAAAIHELTVSANEVASYASDASSAANSAYSASHKGKNDVDIMIHSNTDLITQLESTKSVVTRLARDSESIDSVLTVINEIADQTNLLALNAAIEAARAGEAGRGFAVVADEVRQLANRTQTATTQIQEVVERLSGAASESITKMDHSRNAANQSAGQAKLSGNSLAEITTEANTINEMNLQIATAAKQQACVAESINKNIVAITEVCQETLVSADSIEGSTSTIAELTENLSKIVTTFRH
ncbi:MAG: HAMP domain-containing protein [Neptuniibacter sp.]